MLELFGLGFAVILAVMTILWVISLLIKDSSIVDIFWGSGFVVLAWFAYFAADGYQPRQLLLASIVTLWGLRLTGYIGWRNIGKGEDFRYQKWREEAGQSWWWKSYFRVYVLQGVVMWIVASPLLAANFYDNNHLNLLDFVGVFLWGTGLFFEAVGDFQLARFKANPANKGKVMDKGLWRYTRHPNYFGDAVVWWGFGLIALAAGGFWTIYSPIIMTFLLMKVSGAALLEKTLAVSKPKYADYIERTNAFFPGFPKKAQVVTSDSSSSTPSSSSER